MQDGDLVRSVRRGRRVELVRKLSHQGPVVRGCLWLSAMKRTRVAANFLYNKHFYSQCRDKQKT
jgi:hypothetical protein